MKLATSGPDADQWLRGYLCQDCVVWNANRDCSGADLRWKITATAPAVLSRINAAVVEHDWLPIEFSPLPCDGCETRLWGTRYYALWPVDAFVVSA